MFPKDKQKQSDGNIQPTQHSATSSELEDGQRTSPQRLNTQAPAHAHATRFQQARQSSETEFLQHPHTEHRDGTLSNSTDRIPKAPLTQETPFNVQETLLRQQELIKEAQTAPTVQG